MANYTTQANVVLSVNGKQATQMLNTLEKDAQRLERQIAKAATAGDKATMRKLQRELNNTRRMMDQLRGTAFNVENVLSRLDKATPKELNKALKQLQQQLNGIERGTAAWDAQIAKIKAVKEEIRALNEEMQPDESLWDKLNNFWEKFQLGIAGAVAVLTGLVMAGRKAVNAYAEMEQEMANVQKFTGMSAEEVASLNEELKKIDTRTSREELNQLAQEAGRLGKTSQEDVLGFVRAADKINVALDDLGSGATLTLSKLTGIFGDEARLGTEQALLSVGSVINELSQNCSASAPYLAEFASRMGGVGSQAGLTVQQIMGFAAVLDSNNQKLEASATALSQVIVRIYQDPAKYARVAGMDVQKFSNLVKTDMNAALIELLGTLKQAGNMDVLSPMFKDMGENGSRAISALSTLANHISEVRSQQEVANQAFAEATSIDKEFEVQNNTVQAGLDKAKNRVHELAVELGEKLQPVMRLVISSSTIALKTLSAMVDFFIKYGREIVTITAAIVAYNAVILVYNTRTMIATKSTALFHGAMKLCSGVIPALRLLLVPLINTIQYFTNGLQVNYAMQLRWRKAMEGMKFANWVGLILGVAAAVYLLAKRWAESTTEAERAKRMYEQIEAEAKQSTATQIKLLEELYNRTQDQNLAQDQRIAAIERLRSIYPDYFKDISNEAFLAGKAADAYVALKNSILESARAKGREGMIAKLEEEIQEMTAEYQKEARPWIERKFKAQGKYFLRPDLGSPENDPDYRLANWNLGVIEAQYKPKIEEKKKLQQSLAGQNADYELSKPEESNFAEQFGNGGNGGGGGASTSTGKSSKTTDKFAKENAWKERMLAENRIFYATGEKDYQQYCESIDAIELEYLNRKLSRADLTTNEQLTFQAEYYERYLSMQDTFLNGTKEEEENRYAEAVAALRQRFIDEEMTTKQYNEASQLLEMEHYRKLSEIADRGSKEIVGKRMNALFKGNVDLTERPEIPVADLKAKGWSDAGDEGTATVFSSQYGIKDASGKNTEILVTPILPDGTVLSEKELEDYIYNSLQGTEDILQADTKGIVISVGVSEDGSAGEILHRLQEMYYMHSESEDERKNRKQANEQYAKALFQDEERRRKETEKAQEEHLKRMSEMKKEYFGDNPQEAQAKYDADLAILQQVYDREIQAAGDNAAEKLRIEEAFEKAKLALKKKYGLLAEQDTKNAMAKGVASSIEWLNSDGGKALTGTLDTLVSGMSAVFSQLSSVVQAELDLQTAEINKRYDAEIDRAEGNSYKVKKLEKEKEAEIAKAKNEANRKMFAMQVIQAVAQTATNALNAYGSAAAVPVVGYILAPIAAAMAVAAGAVQIAAIKKQQQASEAQGYMTGGFTPEGKPDEVAGVVHKGEWVASQKLVNNPQTRPLLEALDYAQRTNTIGSLTAADVSRSITAPMLLASQPDPAPVVVQSAPPTVVVEQNSEYAATMRQLADRLNEPFVTVNTVTGDHGIQRAQDEYSKLMKNKSPKSKK